MAVVVPIGIIYRHRRGARSQREHTERNGECEMFSPLSCSMRRADPLRIKFARPMVDRDLYVPYNDRNAE